MRQQVKPSPNKPSPSKLRAALPETPVRVWVGPVAAGLLALGVGTLQPYVSALLVALVFGAVVGNTRLRQNAFIGGHERITKLLLRLGVVFLGLQLPLQDLVAVGLQGVAVICVTVLVTYTATCLIGDRLGVERGLVTLIAAGFSICGASAIAAVESGIKRRDEDVALSIGMVTIFGSAMIVVLPLAGTALGLSDEQVGVWAGASIHEVAQVVAAASAAGAVAVAIATTIKLGRVSLLAGAYVTSRARDRRAGAPAVDGGSAPLIPWFVIGFVITAALRTTGILPSPALDVADFLTTLLLAGAMFGLGLAMRVAELFPVPLRVFGLAASSTGVAATCSLALVYALF